MNRKLSIYTFGLLLIVIAGSSCKRELNYEPAQLGDLAFSEDTIRFDTIFTTFQSPTRRLVVRNRTDKHLTIDRIALEQGNSSEFEIITDGITGDVVEDLTIRKGDSIIIFIEMKSQVTDNFARDRILFETNGGAQFAVLEAFVLDAYFYKYDTLCTQTLPVDKPIVIDGYVIVPEGCTLTIPLVRKYSLPAGRIRTIFRHL